LSQAPGKQVGLIGWAWTGPECRRWGVVPKTPECGTDPKRCAQPPFCAFYFRTRVKCEVVAPTLVPVKAGDRVKTDRRNARKLAQSYRAGDLTPVWVPDAATEALRDLVRAREAAKQDQLRARHRLSKFLLRQGRRPATGVKAWTEKYLAWVRQLSFEHAAQQDTLDDYLHEVEHMGLRVQRLEQKIREAVKQAPAPMREVMAGLQALRGIAEISAVTIASELGSITRFASPRQLFRPRVVNLVNFVNFAATSYCPCALCLRARWNCRWRRSAPTFVAGALRTQINPGDRNRRNPSYQSGSSLLPNQ
jgi:transposase